jgi:hypothetical protein
MVMSSTCHRIALSVDQLMARSREITGIDRVDHDAVDGLTRLHRALNEESCLHERGAQAQQQKLLRLLCNRLRMQRDFARHPEIAEEPIEAPVFVIGMARSGTTKTQKRLAASGDFNFLPFWQNYNPALFGGGRDESPQARIDEADRYCRWFDELSPATKTGHSFETHEPEEETTLTEGCFRTVSFMGYSEIPGYVQWAAQDPLPMFEFLRDSLRYLHWQGLASRSRRWLLKAPIYYGLEPLLLRVFPDAKLVMTHRSPLQTVPSSCRLIELFHQPFEQKPVQAAMLEPGFAMQMTAHLELRRQGAFRTLDVRFDDTVGAMDAVVERIYRHVGLPLSDASRRRMQDWERTHPMHGKGEFRYSLEEYGLNRAQIERDFSGYIAFLDTLTRVGTA